MRIILASLFASILTMLMVSSANAGCRRSAPDVAGWWYYYSHGHKCWLWRPDYHPPSINPVPEPVIHKDNPIERPASPIDTRWPN